MMKHRALVVAFPLLATMPVIVYATVAAASAERGPFAAGLVILVLAGAACCLIDWQLLRRVADLQADLEAEVQRRMDFEAHSREAYGALERKLAERTVVSVRQRDILLRTEKLSSLSRLVGGVAHELNNPLMAILGEATLLRERCQAPELSRGLRVIEQQTQRCANLIRDLSAFAGQQQRQVQPLDVQALVEGALAQTSVVAPSGDVKVVREFSPSPLIVTGNQEQLQQAIVNVMSNAYQAMAAGTAGQLLLRTTPQDGAWVRLEVSDTGVGIAPEALPYIFDPFHSRPPLRDGSGLGMGLSVALGLVQAHGGRIWAESEVGRGTTIYIELPGEQAEPAPEAENPALV